MIQLSYHFYRRMYFHHPTYAGTTSAHVEDFQILPIAIMILRSLWPLKFILSSIILFGILLLLLDNDYLRKTQIYFGDAYSSLQTDASIIPNQVHYVYILQDPESDFTFQFKHFLSIYSVSTYWRPQAIYLHTNANKSTIERAMSGLNGKWNELIFKTSNLRINHINPPTTAENGVSIDQMEHRSDFARVAVVHEFGGIYLDWDAHPIRDIKPLRESGFNSVTGRQAGGEIMSGTFMAKKDALLIRMWKKEMHRLYDGGWTTHSNGAVTRLGQRLAGLPNEVLIMEQNAFGPGSWTASDNILLYGLHNDTDPDLTTFTNCTALPLFDEGLLDRWERPQDFPPWQTDYSQTYILHAFNPARNGNPVPDFEQITPKYIFARQSDFARALYPITKHMCDSGLIKMDDSYLG